MSNPHDRLGYLPPQALDLEESVLGAALMQKDATIQVLEILTPEDFYDTSNGNIFKAIQSLAKQGHPIDMRTVRNELTKMNLLEQSGGAYRLAELTSKVSSAANVQYHSYILKEHTIKRKIINLCSKSEADGYENHTDAFTLLADLRKGVSDIEKAVPGRREISMKDLIAQQVQVIQTREESTLEFSGVPCGFPLVDKMTLGFQKTDLIILAARPGMGKTSFMLQSAINAAINYKIPVGIFTLEMSAWQLGLRAASIMLEMEMKDLQRKKFNAEDWVHYSHGTHKLANAPIYFDDRSYMTLTDLRAGVARMIAEYGIQEVWVDYIQLMSGERGEKGNREQEISFISRGLKAIAKEFNIPVIALAQLSRKVEDRGGLMKPIPADLRESGSIEQDADMIMFLWRPEYYYDLLHQDKFLHDHIGDFIPGATEVNIAKFRNGATGSTYIKLIGRYTKFVHIDSPYTHYTPPGPVETTGNLFLPRTTSPLPPERDDLNNPYPNNDDTPF